MADSTSQPFFILFFGRGVSREAHNQSASRTCKRDLFQIVLVLVLETETDRARATSTSTITKGEGCLCFPSALLRFARMNKTVIEVQVRAVLPTSGGCAVFL